MAVGMTLGLNGNAITLGTALCGEIEALSGRAMGEGTQTAAGLKAVVEARSAAGLEPLRLGVVFAMSTHDLELRYWLAASGIDPDVDVELVVVPPPRMVSALREGALAGFCVGEPWNSVAVAEGLGRVVTTKHAIWNHSPEKVLGVTASWADAYPNTHLGYQTQVYEGFQGYVEFEDVRALDDDRYNAAGLNGQPTRSVIADPEVTELNQLWVNYVVPVDGVSLSIKPGRQVIALDDQRFVGHVGWRQDQQTFDAVSVKSDLGLAGLTAMYAYVWQANRIFAEERDFDSESHLLNVSYDVEGVGKVTGFAYLLDFENGAANSSQTYGARLAGKKKLDETLSLNYQASVAFQQDYGDNSVDYDAMYYLLDAGLSVADVGTFGAGYEVLGSDDGGFAFRTPLATGHKFNGFADVFLVTPNDGLEDCYVYFSPANLPYGLKGKVAYHFFSGNEDVGSYGQEIDAVLSKKVNDHVTVGAKYAYFMTDEPGFAERTRFTFDATLWF